MIFIKAWLRTCLTVPQGSCDGRYHLRNKSVEVAITWTLDIKIPVANIVDGLIVNHERAVRVFDGEMCGQDGIVGFHHCCADPWSRVNCKLKLGFFPIVEGQPFHEQGREARSSATSKGVENEKSLKAMRSFHKSSGLC